MLLARRLHSGGVRIPAGIAKWLDDLDERLEQFPLRRQLVRAAVERTIQDAIELLPDGTAYVRTGDIPAMWLRDSAAQVRPLLDAGEYSDVADLLVAVSKRQLRFIAIDPYANAFNATPSGAGYHRDFVDQHPSVWERKYEVDSLAWVFDLSYRIWQVTGRIDHIDDAWLTAARQTIRVWQLEQHHDQSPYTFVRPNVPPIDTLSHGGRGAPVGYTGMTWSGFRPSDDACTYGYLVPSNCFAAVALDGMADIAAAVLHESALANDAHVLAQHIQQGIDQFGVVQVDDESFYAYEVDGRGNALFIDDANVPSLLSLPYLGHCAPDDPRYLTTRRRVLSELNPHYVAGSQLAGVGSPHTPDGWVWPLAIAMQGLTSTSLHEQQHCLALLEDSARKSRAMHESVDADDVSNYTRPWFSWADMTYVELVLKVVRRNPV